jgi:GNAT superfamily N-acetyltransferase
MCERVTAPLAITAMSAQQLRDFAAACERVEASSALAIMAEEHWPGVPLADLHDAAQAAGQACKARLATMPAESPGYHFAAGTRAPGLYDEDVDAALEMLTGYQGAGISSRDLMAHALLAARASAERRAIRTRADERRRTVAETVRLRYSGPAVRA